MNLRAGQLASQAREKQHPKRHGFSLLEVVLALAVAAIAISLLAQLINVGQQAAAVARDQSKAQILAESIMAEYTSGVAGTPDALAPSSGVFESDANWSYVVDVALNAGGTINVITVTVTQVEANNPISFSLTQWLAIPPEPEEEETETEGATA